MTAFDPERTCSEFFLLDHMVGAHDERLRNSEPECFRCPEIDSELKAAGLLNRQIRGLAALKSGPHNRLHGEP